LRLSCGVGRPVLARGYSRFNALCHRARNLRGEIDSAAQYRALAKAEPSEELREVYTRLAAVEDRHADAWREALAGEVGSESAQPALVS
jgi:hypothetical protein